ncbi:MAG: 50S ribosomal protein L29 [Candidatus Omnitrophota bacterium]
MKIKAKDLKNLTLDELKHKEISLKEELIKMRSQAQLGTLEKPSQIRETRKTLARIETVLREKKYAGAR